MSRKAHKFNAIAIIALMLITSIYSGKLKSNSISQMLSNKSNLAQNGGKSGGVSVGDALFSKGVAKACVQSIIDTMNPEFCWKSGGEAGIIPTGCPSGWTRSGALCYEECDTDFLFVAGVCRKGKYLFVPSSVPNFSSEATCPSGYYKSRALCYKDCDNIGMTNCGIGACSDSTASCASSIITMGIDTIIGVTQFVSFVMTAGASSAATPAVNTGKQTVAKMEKSTIQKTFGRLKDAFTKFFDATVRKAKKSFMDNLKGVPAGKTAEFFASTYCEAIYQGIKTKVTGASEPKSMDISDIAKKFDVFGISDVVTNCKSGDGTSCAKSVVNAASTFDPTGLLTIAGTFIQPTCAVDNYEERTDVKRVLNYFKSPCPTCETKTITNDKGNNHVIFLNRHDIRCDQGSVLNSLIFNTSAGSLISKYRCLKSASVTNNCRSMITNRDSYGSADGSINFLDKHNIDCKAEGWFLQSLALKTEHTKRQMWYEYTCCQVNNHYATHHFMTNRSDASKNWILDDFSVADAIDGGEKGVLSSMKMNTLSIPNKLWYDYKVGFIDFNSERDSTIYDKFTNYNKAGEGSIWYLDRHEMNCDQSNSAMKDFTFQRDRDRIRFYYRCLKNKLISNTCETFYTNYNYTNQDDKKSIDLLGRHKVQCKVNTTLKGFAVERSPHSQNMFRIKYTCCNTQYYETYSNRFDKTDMGGYETFSLDKQRTPTGPEEVIQAFWLETSYNPDLLDIAYTAAILK